MSATLPPISATVSPSAGTFSCCPNWACCDSGSVGGQNLNQNREGAQAGGSIPATAATTPATAQAAAAAAPAATAAVDPKSAVSGLAMARDGAVKV